MYKEPNVYQPNIDLDMHLGPLNQPQANLLIPYSAKVHIKNLSIEIPKQKVYWKFMHEPNSLKSYALPLHPFTISIHITLLKESNSP